MRRTTVDHVKQLCHVLRSFDLQFNTQFASKCLGEFVFIAGRAVAIDVISGGTRTGSDNQRASGAYLSKEVGLFNRWRSNWRWMYTAREFCSPTASPRKVWHTLISWRA